MSASRQRAIMAQFEEAQPLLEALKTHVCAQLEPLLAPIATQSITARVKAAQSIQGKLARPEKTYQSLTDLTDLLGVRVITYFEDGVDEVARRIEASLDVDLTHTIDKRAFEALDRFGYRSLHYICHAPPELLDEHGQGEELRGLRFEIQVRTILQHAWAEIEHDMGYKSSTELPAVLRRRFSRLAGLLELADEEFVAIRKALDLHQEEVQAKVVQGQERIPLDLHALRSFLSSPLMIRVDEALAQHLGLALIPEPFYPDYLLHMLSLVGLDHVGALHKALDAHQGELAAFSDIYFEFSQTAWGLALDDLDAFRTGYGLLFLAHLQVFLAPGLDVERVARATEFFLALDEATDAGQARVLAAQFCRHRQEQIPLS